MHSAGGIPISSDLISSQQGTVHRAVLSILRSRDKTIRSVEMFTEWPYTVHASNNRCSAKFVFAIENKFTVFTTIDSGERFFPCSRETSKGYGAMVITAKQGFNHQGRVPVFILRHLLDSH